MLREKVYSVKTLDKNDLHMNILNSGSIEVLLPILSEQRKK